MTTTIYIITNKLNGKRYIGQTMRYAKRMLTHKLAKEDTFIHRAIRKHGWENFEATPLCVVEDFMADETEAKCIKSYNTLAPNGYNLTEGGQKNRGSYSEASRQKMSDSQLKKISSDPEHKKRVLERIKKVKPKDPSKNMKQRWETPEFRDFMMKVRLGMKHSDKTREQMRENSSIRKPVVRSDGKKYRSVQEAARVENLPYCTLRRYITSGKVYKNFLWRFENDIPNLQ